MPMAKRFAVSVPTWLIFILNIMKNYTLLLLFVFFILAASCTRTVYMPVETVRRDSVVAATVKVDSVLIADSVVIEARADTVFKTVTRRRETVRLVHDTLRVAAADTVRITLPPPSSPRSAAGGVPWWMCLFAMAAVIYLLKKRKNFNSCW